MNQPTELIHHVTALILEQLAYAYHKLRHHNHLAGGENHADASISRTRQF